MIGRLRGNVLEKQPPLVLIEVNGVGYEVYMPMTCFYNLPEINQETVIFVHFIVREDSQLLFGFNNQQERTLFCELIKINGIGPKLALTILSSMSVEQFITAIENKETKLLIKLPGIGKKTAERMVMEMKDNFGKIQNCLLNENLKFEITSHSCIDKNDPVSEAIAALVSLGFQLHEAKKMITKVKESDDTNCENLIRKALCTVI